MTNAAFCVCWDFFLPQFRRSLCVLADVDQGYATLEWRALPPDSQAAITAEIERMSVPRPKRAVG